MGRQVQLLQSNISGLADTLAEIDGLQLLLPEDVPPVQPPTTTLQSFKGTTYPPLPPLHRPHSPSIGAALRAAESAGDATGQHPFQQEPTNDALVVPETAHTTALQVAEHPLHAQVSAPWQASTMPWHVQNAAAVASQSTLPLERHAGSPEEEATAVEAGIGIAGSEEIKVRNPPPVST